MDAKRKFSVKFKENGSTFGPYSLKELNFLIEVFWEDVLLRLDYNFVEDRSRQMCAEYRTVSGNPWK